MNFELIIFDLDGVLIDSVELYNRLFHEMLIENEIDTSYEDLFSKINGMSLESCISAVEQAFAKNLPANFTAEYESRAIDIFRKKLQPIKGIASAMNQIQQAVCVASGSSHTRIRLSLELTGLSEKFGNNIFSASDVIHGKPAPDLFLYAAKKMGYPPKQCAVVEDSIPGVQAGVAASMTVFAYTKSENANTLVEAGAHFIFDDMRQLPNLLQPRLKVL